MRYCAGSAYRSIDLYKVLLPGKMNYHVQIRYVYELSDLVRQAGIDYLSAVWNISGGSLAFAVVCGCCDSERLRARGNIRQRFFVRWRVFYERF